MDLPVFKTDGSKLSVAGCVAFRAVWPKAKQSESGNRKGCRE